MQLSIRRVLGSAALGALAGLVAGCPSHPADSSAPTSSSATSATSVVDESASASSTSHSHSRPHPKPSASSDGASDAGPIEETASTVAELKKRAPGKARYVVEAAVSVLDLSACPACPPASECPPCTKFKCVVSDVAKSIPPGQPLGPDDIALAAGRDDVAHLEVGHRYKLHVTLWRRSMSIPLMAKLVSIDPQ